MKNLLAVAIPAFFWAISDILSRISSNKINETLGALMVSIGMLIMMVIFSIFIIPDISKEFSLSNYKHISLALLAGGANAVGFFFFFKFLHQGGNFTQGLPMIQIILVSLGVIYGIIFFKDPLSLKIIIGLVLAAGAIYFLSS